MQNPSLFGHGKFGQRRNKRFSVRAPDHRFIARKLAIECNPRSSEPDERMEPQDAQRNFVKQTEQIVTPPCMG